VIEEILNRTKHFGVDPENPPVHARSIFVRRLESLPILME